MNINKIFSIGLAAIALAACTAEPLRNPDMDKQANLPGAPKTWRMAWSSSSSPLPPFLQ